MSSRRRFISGSLGTVALGGALPGFLREAASAQTLRAAATDPRNVLVVVQLAGGNDGLNTIVPYSDDAYHRVRPALRVAANSVLKIDDRVGFNPVLLGLNELYKSGQVAIVHGVGYPNPNRSHFEATQIWETASPDRPLSTGWLGRYLDRLDRNATGTTSFAGVTLGDTVPSALLAQHVDVPAIGALNNFQYNAGKDATSKAAAGPKRSMPLPYCVSIVVSTTAFAMARGSEAWRAMSWATSVGTPGASIVSGDAARYLTPACDSADEKATVAIKH